MNLGIYISSIGNTEELQGISECINNAIETNTVKDASIFFDDVDYNPFKINCGMFNAADLWNFSGSLITSNIDCLKSASKIVNNIRLYYYYGIEKHSNVFNLLKALSNTQCSIICSSKEAAQNLYRISGITPIGISEDYKDITSLIKANEDGQSKNSQDVCRTE